MGQFKNKTAPYYWRWIEDMDWKENEKGYIDVEDLLFVRKPTGEIVFYIEKYSTCFDIGGIGNNTYSIIAIAEGVWEIDFTSTENILPVQVIHEHLFMCSKEINRDYFYGPFCFETTPQKYDTSNIVVKYASMLKVFNDALFDEHDLEDAGLKQSRKDLIDILPQYLEQIESSQSNNVLQKKLDFLLQWREIDEEICKCIEKLLIPCFEKAAKEVSKVQIMIMDQLVKYEETKLWKAYTSSLSAEKIADYARYEYIHHEATYEQAVDTIEQVYGNHTTQFGKKVYIWYTETFLPIYKTVWDNLKNEDQGKGRIDYVSLAENYKNKKEISLTDLKWLIMKAKEKQDFELLIEIKKNAEHALVLAELSN